MSLKIGLDRAIGSIDRSIKFQLTDIIIKRLARRSPLKIIIGALRTHQTRWLSTNVGHLNILNSENLNRYFRENSIDAMLAEHVWEHFNSEEATLAAQNCYKYLKYNRYLRVAVPDGFHPSPQYIMAVKPGGIGRGAKDHKVLYNYITFLEVFKAAGFHVELLEWFDEDGTFHRKEWQESEGLIKRSSRHDERNKDGLLNYTSIILDAWKR